MGIVISSGAGTAATTAGGSGGGADAEEVAALFRGIPQAGVQWSELAGVPVAVLGLAGYLLLLGSLALPEDLGRSAAALLALVGAGFSAWLTYVEIAKLDAICQWCAASAAIMVALAVVSLTRLLRVD